MTGLLSFEGLRGALADRTFDRPPAFVANAHITGLGVARALAAHDVPVVALDRTGGGVAPGSTAVEAAGRVTYPLSDLEGFREDVEALAAECGHEPVAFGCMDEWVHAFADTDPAGVRLPFADREVIDAVLDKESLYGIADDLGVPYPETYRLRETLADGGDAAVERAPPVRTAEEAADELGFPLVVKPALKREFEEAVGTNVVEVDGREEYDEAVERARAEGIRIMAQEKVPVVEGEDCSLASYVPPPDTARRAPESADSGAPEGAPLALTGNPTRYPRAYGTSCLVDVVDVPAVERRALAVIEETGYHGISEAEFVYDGDRGEYVLLDINTRPWKWIGLPVAAGSNLPMAAYAEATGVEYDPGAPTADRWVYLRDYLALLAEDPTFRDALAREEWLSVVAGEFDGVTTAVYDPADPGPTYRVLQTALGGPEYYCSC